ncbi:unnamed protein product [Orchesella dallaii]|uniref:Uncharacterized protein n=1 Tax=Orchesella dallaii TaxID=48710 RepID=A0ABP1QME4_9HEXA
MEEWESEIIKKNMDKLVQQTSCNSTLLITLVASSILSNNDVDELSTFGNDKSAQAYKFYNMMITRKRGFEMLVKALHETKQSGAVNILTTGRVNRRMIGLDELSEIAYDENTLVGKGMYGTTVFKGKWSNRDVAVKRVLSFSEIEKNAIANEIDNLKLCDSHENVVRYFGAKEVQNFVVIVLELCEMTLKHWVTKDKSIQINQREILRQITVGLEWLHENDILLLGMKPENVLLKRKPARVKLSGFGLSTRVQRTEELDFVPKHNVVETLGFEAPELEAQANETLEDKPKCTFASDVYSLGCMYYYVLTDGANDFGDLKNIENLEKDLEHSDEEYKAIVQDIIIIKQMISDDPTTRPSCSSLLSQPILKSRSSNENKGGDQNKDLLTEEAPLLRFIQKNNPQNKQASKTHDKLIEAGLIDIVLSDNLNLIKICFENLPKDMEVRGIWNNELKSVLLHVAVNSALNSQGFSNILSEELVQDPLIHECIWNIHQLAIEKFENKCRTLRLLFKLNPRLVDSKDKDGLTPLHHAILRHFDNKNQRHALIDLLINNNADLDAKDYDDVTPLQRSLKYSLIEVVMLLIHNGASPDEQFFKMLIWKNSPLLFHKIIECFSNKVRNKNFPDIDEVGSVLHFAVSKFEVLEKTLEIFKRDGYDFKMKNKLGQNILHVAIEAQRDESFLKTLIMFGADWRAEDNHKWNMIHYSAHSSNMPALKLFISLGCDINAKDVLGDTPLHCMFSSQIEPSTECVIQLIQHGADVNSINYQGLSPAHMTSFVYQTLAHKRVIEILQNYSNKLLP